MGETAAEGLTFYGGKTTRPSHAQRYHVATLRVNPRLWFS